MDLRCFVAVEIPESVRRSIGDIIEILKKTGADVKWVHYENIHITMKFLGATGESLVETIKDALNKKLLPYNPFYIKISGIGCFPDTRRPRVIWVGIEDSDLIKNLQRDIEDEMVKLDYPADSRAFSPHLTIGRVRSPKRMTEMLKRLNEFSTLTFENIEINGITLMKSELNPAGAKYYTLAEIPFGRRN